MPDGFWLSTGEPSELTKQLTASAVEGTPVGIQARHLERNVPDDQGWHTTFTGASLHGVLSDAW
jgi:hypothetical protein